MSSSIYHNVFTQGNKLPSRVFDQCRLLNPLHNEDTYVQYTLLHLLQHDNIHSWCVANEYVLSLRGLRVTIR